MQRKDAGRDRRRLPRSLGQPRGLPRLRSMPRRREGRQYKRFYGRVLVSYGVIAWLVFLIQFLSNGDFSRSGGIQSSCHFGFYSSYGLRTQRRRDWQALH